MKQRLLQLTSSAGALAAVATLAFAFQNCSPAKFTNIDPTEKDSALGSQSVFPAASTPLTGGNDGSAVAPTPNPSPNGAVATNPTPTLPPPNGAPTNGAPTNGGGQGGHGSCGQNGSGSPTVGFSFSCSNRLSAAAAGGTGISNVISDGALTLAVFASDKSAVCQITGDFRDQILNTKSITIVPCSAALDGKSYVAFVVDASANVPTYAAASAASLVSGGIPFTVTSTGTASILSKHTFSIIYDLNSQNSEYAGLNNSGGSTATTQKSCDQRESPLLISFNDGDTDSNGVVLSAPMAGVQFDILGQRSYPAAHDPKQISWFLENVAPAYYFITLPNSQGEVLGIDQMFGNNTVGPDGQYADNGYLALAKFDANHDGYITKDDPIFSQLRLWRDSNRDGVAQPEELFTLDQMQITRIDLQYSTNYQETDQYGNQTLMKSVAQTADGKLHLMFDLWFRYVDITGN